MLSLTDYKASRRQYPLKSQLSKEKDYALNSIQAEGGKSFDNRRLQHHHMKSPTESLLPTRVKSLVSTPGQEYRKVH